MRSLRGRILSTFVLAILFNVLIIVASAFLASERSREQWRVMVTVESQRKLGMVVNAIWQEHGAINPYNSREILNQVTLFADELASFAIYDADKRPIYYWRNHSYTALDPDFSLRPQMAVMVSDDVIGWVACVPSDFYFISANQGMVRQMVTILMIGLAVSLTVAIAVSNRMSRSATRDARLLANLLGRLSRGERGLPFPDQGVEEFQTIAQASARLQATLAKQEKQRRQWTQDIAHDLKTPVTALRGQLEAIKDGVFPLTEERFAVLEREFGTIDKLVRDLALLSQVESPEMIPVIHKIDAGPLLDDIESRFTAVAESVGLGFSCKGDRSLVFLADPDLLTRAVNNLIQNAIQHARLPGKVTVELTAEGKGVALAVENPGRIPEKDLPLLFERLYRGDAGRSTPGSGLGLTIARAVATKLGGSVTARNTSRETVRMRLVLPHRA